MDSPGEMKNSELKNSQLDKLYKIWKEWVKQLSKKFIKYGMDEIVSWAMQKADRQLAFT